MAEVTADREAHGKAPFDDDEQPPTSGKKQEFAYEAHTACDRNGFVLDVIVTLGNVHDSVVFDNVYDKVAATFPEIGLIDRIQ